MSSLKEIFIKNCMYYFFDDMINIKDLDPKKIKTDEKSYENILIYHTEYVTLTTQKFIVQIRLYFIINKINEYIEESDGKNIWHSSYWWKQINSEEIWWTLE